MEDLIIEATKSTPAVRFDVESHTLEIKGESYPENAAKFYSPIFRWLQDYLGSPYFKSTEVNLEIIYFNSSSSKALMNFFDLLDEAAEKGKNIVVNWIYHEENETALECGEEFMEDAVHIQFNLVEMSD